MVFGLVKIGLSSQLRRAQSSLGESFAGSIFNVFFSA